ncbi:hypothetical protein G6F23_012726 [Rhizopus arrhizus]|nr:hypothetical protein G6F23_012726 [Rhizopus arrhizus]
MACATGQAHRRVTQLVGRGLDRVHHQRRTVRGLRAAQLREACRQAQRLQVVGHPGHQRFRERVQHGVAVAAHFQRQLHPAGHGVGGVRRHRQAAHRGHHVMRIAAGGAGLAAGGIDDARRADQRVAADIHGGGAGMIGLAFHHDQHAADAYDVGDHADRQAAAFQDGALFDMQFDKRRGVARAAQGGMKRRRVAADAGNALGQRLAVGVAGGQHVGRQLARERAAAHARDAVVAGFFGQEVDDFERMRQFDAVFLHRVRDFDAGQDADDAVETAAGHDGVAMRAGGNRLAGRVAPGAGADQVAARVQAGGQAGGFEFAVQPGASLVEQGRKGAALGRH